MEQLAPFRWPLWYRIIFRFVFVYFILFIFTFPILDYVPLLREANGWLMKVTGWPVEFFNARLVHFRPELVPPNGSGDTSFVWVQVLLHILLAGIATVIWSWVARARSHYRAEYFLALAMRYFVALAAIAYGIIKLFALQMSFPSNTMLATPLGDLLPMRFSWMFFGYSPTYQIFSGIMELTVALLLLYRRTATLGIFIGFAVFLNVMMINLCYDVPVKIFSMHLAVMCLLLLLNDLPRLWAFFVGNRKAEPSAQFHYQPAKRPARVIRIALKSLFVLMCLGMCVDIWQMRAENIARENYVQKPIREGVYDVVSYVRNGVDVPVLARDTLIWKDLIFEKDPKFPWVSVGSCDTMFRQRYRRGMFEYKADTIKKELVCFTFKAADSAYLFTMRYHFAKDTVLLCTKIRNDSVRLKLLPNERKFKLAERQFHWLSERNR